MHMSLTTNRLTIGLLLLTLCLAAPVAAAEVDGQYTLKLAVPLETDQPIDESIGSVGLKTDSERSQEPWYMETKDHCILRQ